MDAIWYDAIILALLIFCAWRGASKGFAWQVATIGAIVLCFVFAEKASLILAPLITVDPPLNRWIAMFALYIGASFVSFAVARMIRGTLKKWQFEEFDSHLGAVFGFIKGVAFALVITFFAVTLSESLRGQVLASHSGYAAGQILVAFHPVMPDEFHGVIDPYIEKLGHTVVHDHDDHAPGHQHDEDEHAHDHGDETSHDDFGAAPWQGSESGTADPPLPADWGSDGDDGGFGPPPAFKSSPASGPIESAPKESPTAITDFERIVDDIPDDLKNSALQALRNTKQEDREELLSTFETAIPSVIKAVSQEWANGKPAGAGGTTQRETILREIAAVYNKDPEAQRNIVRQAEAALLGVPDEVATVVIRDWYADIFGLTDEDPDPATNFETRFDERIRRQLEAFGISLDRVRAELRDRLQGMMR